MSQVRFRMTRWRSLVLVAVLVILAGTGVEVFVILPREHPRLEHASMHRRRAEGFSRMANTSEYRLSDPVRRDLRDLSDWHRRRSEEIRKVPKFDPGGERKLDAEHGKVEDAILFDYAQETRSI